MSLQARLHDSEIILDLSAKDLESLVRQTVDKLSAWDKLSPDQRTSIERQLEQRGTGAPRDLGSGVGVLRVRYPSSDGGDFRCTLVRVPDGVHASDHERIHFLWLLFAPEGVATPRNEELEPFGWMLHDERFNASILGANDPMQVLATYQLYLEHIEAPPELRHPSLTSPGSSTEPSSGTGFAANLVADIRRRAPHYVDDFKAGLHPKGVASVLFLFFACLAPSVAFGGLLNALTDGELGAVEAIAATAVGGVTYALFSGQPLTLLGSTGPVTIFFGILYSLTTLLGVSFVPALFWVGLWTSIILLVAALTNLSRYISYFTRFTDEIFGALIAIIFIVAAVRNIFGGFVGDEVPTNGQLLALLLALGTFFIALQLSRIRQQPLLNSWIREFLADFGPAIAILSMTAVALMMRPIELEQLTVPDSFATTTGRPWVVNPLDSPVWFWAASFPIALLGSVLMYLDQNITVRLVNAPQHHLKKGDGYSLDMAVVAVLVGVCAVFGLPWVVAATVRSLNHVRSLATVEHHARGEHIISVRENRLTGFLVHALIGCSLLALDLLRQVPMSVIFGLFLFMGIASARGNQFIDRLKLWVTDPNLYPPTHYIRRVPRRVVHAFTAIQVVCLAVLWFVMESPAGVAFPLVIGLLVVVRFALNKFFDPTHLAFLDAEEVPEDEQYRAVN